MRLMLKMRLRMLENKDIKGMLEWMHDPNVYRYFRFQCENYTENDAREFIKKAKNDFVANKHRHYAIVDEQDTYLGTISLKDIDNISLTAEYAISLRACVQGKGIATQATRALLDIAFHEIGLQRVFLNVLSDNTTAIHLYEKCGFQYEGEFRQHILIRGNIHSLKWYGILKAEYEKMSIENDRKEYLL